MKVYQLMNELLEAIRMGDADMDSDVHFLNTETLKATLLNSVIATDGKIAFSSKTEEELLVQFPGNTKQNKAREIFTLEPIGG